MWFQCNSTSFKMKRFLYRNLYNNQINARALIGQSAVGYCAGFSVDGKHFENEAFENDDVTTIT